MLDPISVIRAVNTTCQQFFVEQNASFLLRPSSANSYRLQATALSTKAINHRNNDREEVDVIPWFADYWLYVEMTFLDSQTFISISIFQGEAGDATKHQLFRAEWDDFDNADQNHPQPHWHITASQSMDRTFSDWVADEDVGGFVQLLDEERKKVSDVNRVHFAMNGNWINDQTDVHRLDDEIKIRKWFQGLLAHLRRQLEYIS